jgi:hypothetical protein
VLSQAPISFAPVTATDLQRLTGLFLQTVRISNPTPRSFPALRLWIRLDTNSLAHGVRVWNSAGASNGLPYLAWNQPLTPGQSVDLSVEYYIPDRRTMPNPALSVEVAPADPAQEPVGTPLAVDRCSWLADGTVWVEFGTVSNRLYYMQYGSDLQQWRTALPAITGTGRRVSWLDSGPPKTDCLPQAATNRFYRILLLP